VKPLRILLGIVGLAVVFVVADMMTGGRLSLRVSHAIQCRIPSSRTATKIRVPGIEPLPMFLQPGDTVITRTMLDTGMWEPNETHWFVKSLRPGDVVVDAGANVGYYTILASKLVGPTGRVYAFEPDPAAFAVLERNVRLNGADNVVAEQKALSNENTTLKLFIASDNRGDDRIYQPENEQRPSIDVPAVRLDDYLRGKVEHVDFVKMDTQGAEYVIVDGMRDILRDSPDLVMVVEFWPSGLAGLGSDAGALLKLLRAADFRFYNLGAYSETPGSIGEVDEATLLAQHTLANKNFTNLFCAKGYARSLAQPANDRLIAPTAPPPGRPTRTRG
jgi:FkbM family methyltransferase